MMRAGPFDVATCQYRCRHVRGRMGVCCLLSLSEPQFVVELSQMEAILSTSNKSLEDKAAESAPESAEEDVEHDCEYHDYPSSEVTESTDSDSDQDLRVQGRGRGRGQGRSRRGRKQTSEPERENLSVGWTEDVHLPDLTFDTE